MQIRLDIKRQQSPDDKSYIQSIVYEYDDKSEVLSNALGNINKGGCKDTEGNDVSPISWECSCLQKKCGACAMVIGGRPRLACDAKLSEFATEGFVTVEPLSKFPLIRDLSVDRSVMFDTLRRIRLWLESDAYDNDKVRDIAYESSGCLQCGCCLEVCPNFYVGGKFYGMAAGLPMSKIIAQSQKGNDKDIRQQYKKHFYSGCGKSLACRNICPAGLDADRVMASSNAAAVWKRNVYKKK